MVMVKIWPWGTSGLAVISGARGWVGPRRKLPSSLSGGTAPSGSSFFLTKPGELGSRPAAAAPPPPPPRFPRPPRAGADAVAVPGWLAAGGVWAHVIADRKPVARARAARVAY